MGLRSLLAKDWKLDVNTGPVETPVWTPVKGLTSFKETTDDSTEDDGDFDDEEGWGSEVVTERKWKIEAEGRRKRTDAATFTPDLGQEAIRKAARKVGFGANILVRWYRRDGAPDAYEGTCTVSDFAKGGSTTDLEPFSFSLNGQGAPKEITNPITDEETP
ncbi:phage tail tube protein (plasmid) [Microtetraspora malaysiensis]|uniref:phage tail tube protein n=1 Tax=Microtetraspora malaysiensis TaxID=161358 RepID=UPI003D90DA2F